MAVKTVDMAYLQGQNADLFRAAIESRATRDPYERRLIGFCHRVENVNCIGIPEQMISKR
jgi:hypothetical protein